MIPWSFLMHTAGPPESPWREKFRSMSWSHLERFWPGTKNPGNAKWSAASPDMGVQKDSIPYLGAPQQFTATALSAQQMWLDLLVRVKSTLYQNPAGRIVSEQKTWRWGGLSTLPSSDIYCAAWGILGCVTQGSVQASMLTWHESFPPSRNPTQITLLVIWPR